ncbi:predicted protein [Histoplasma capsulatum G186AR]|uniref:Uncharacterized protein n=1 Tax=Ajellomyces capsulatus (strain G186AR / H82 / ATCC MYA-2454 / RMSCC 2432) TaxID=447093 RepID=C0NKL2_AJECG|nr:uncharacterized protein HCBG_03692 [Histoplasma capsulatum G186AR]EEH08403.1 predicted protein [Histoplasma capsulatum G186AR]
MSNAPSTPPICYHQAGPGEVVDGSAVIPRHSPSKDDACGTKVYGVLLVCMDAARHVPAGSISDPGRKTDITSVCRLVHSISRVQHTTPCGLIMDGDGRSVLKDQYANTNGAGIRKVTQRYDTIRYDTRGTNANKSFNES